MRRGGKPPTKHTDRTDSSVASTIPQPLRGGWIEADPLASVRDGSEPLLILTLVLSTQPAPDCAVSKHNDFAGTKGFGAAGATKPTMMMTVAVATSPLGGGGGGIVDAGQENQEGAERAVRRA